MAFQPVPDCAKLAIVQSRAGEQMVNILHATRSGQWGNTELDALAGAVLNQWAAGMMPYLSQTVQLLRVEARGLRAQADVFTTAIPTQAVFGGYTASPMPGNVAFCLTLSTGLTGRANRGRLYIGGLHEAAISGDTMLQTFADAFRNELSALLNEIRNAGWTPVVVSRRLNGQPRNPPATIEITSVRYADRTLDSQRRRLRGRGQ